MACIGQVIFEQGRRYTFFFLSFLIARHARHARHACIVISENHQTTRDRDRRLTFVYMAVGGVAFGFHSTAPKFKRRSARSKLDFGPI